LKSLYEWKQQMDFIIYYEARRSVMQMLDRKLNDEPVLAVEEEAVEYEAA
jgi:hypothetical protein